MARFGRSFPLHPRLARALTGASVMSATASDSAPATDTATRAAQAVTRTAADTAAAVDTATRSAQTKSRTASDSAPAVDTITYEALGRAVTDSAPAVDTATRAAQVFARTASDSAPAVDVATVVYHRTVSDSAPAVDTATRAAMVFARTAGDTAPATDTATRAAQALARTAADSAPAVDTAGHVSAALARSASDSAPATDTATRAAQAKARTGSDTAAAVDSATGVITGAGIPAIVANPYWPLVGHEIDFQSGPPSLPLVTRMSVNAPYRRLFVRGFQLDRGRSYELDQAQAGTNVLDLPDPLELLNPDNTGSPFNAGGNDITPYRAYWCWAMWPNQPGSGNINNPQVNSAYDPSFEAGLGGWAAFSGSTAALSTTQAFTGTHSMKITQATAGQSSYGAYNQFRTAPKITYTFSAYVFPTGGATVTLGVNLADGTTATSLTASVQNVWTRLFVSWTTVDTLETVFVYTSQANPTFYVDAAQLEFGSNLTAFTTAGPTLYPQFTGYVERYPTSYDMSGLRAQRPLVAVDALAPLSRAAINQSYDTEVDADNPALYYRLDNTVSPATAAQLDMGAVGPKLAPGMGPGAVPYFTVSASGSINWAGDSHPDGTPAVVFTGQNSANPPTNFAANSFTEMPVSGGVITLNPQTGFSWECWIRWTSGTAQVGTLEVLASGNPAGLNQNVPLIGAVNFINALGIAYNPDGTQFQYFTRNSSQGGALFADGTWHYLYMTVLGGVFHVGFDGAGLGGSISAHSVGPIAFNTFYSEASAQYSIAQAQNSTGRVAVYNSILSNTRFLAHYQRGVGYLGETSGARITRLLNTYWGGAISVAAGTALMAPDFSYNTRSVLDVGQEIEETERGLLFVTRPGVVTFHDRSTRYASQIPVAVFGENPNPVVPLNSNAYFELNTLGWTVSGCTLGRTTAYHHQGAAAGVMTPDGVTATPLIRSVPAAVTVGTSYTGDVWLYSDAPSSNVSVFVDWLNGSGTQIGTSPTQSITLGPGVWTQLTCSGVAPASTATARIAVVISGTPATTALLYVDEARLYPSSQVDELPYKDYRSDHDPTYTFTQANVTRPGNSSIPPMVNTAATAKYGQRILTQDLQVNQDFDVTQAQMFYLARYGTPKTRVTTLQLDPAANPTLWPVVLGLEIGQRIRIVRRTALTVSNDYYIEKISQRQDVKSGSWTFDLQVSPMFVPSAWVLGDSTYGVMGSTTAPIY